MNDDVRLRSGNADIAYPRAVADQHAGREIGGLFTWIFGWFDGQIQSEDLFLRAPKEDFFSFRTEAVMDGVSYRTSGSDTGSRRAK